MIAVGGHPAHVVPSLDGWTAYVTDAETDSVLVVDLAAGRVTETIKVGKSRTASDCHRTDRRSPSPT